MNDFSASEILAIPLSDCLRLFPGDLTEARKAHRRLVVKWHPDRAGGQGDVMSHINVLFEKATERLIGPTASALRIEGRSASFDFQYRTKHQFELGFVYVARSFVAYLIDKEFCDLAVRAPVMIASLKYRDSAMRAEHERYMPQMHKLIELKDGRVAVVFRKKPEQVMLSEVLQAIGPLDPKHVAWILSSLYNVNCYIKWAGICHNDIGTHSFFIDAQAHNGALIGGWWYAARETTKPIAVPARTRRAGSNYTTKAIDGSLIRMTGIELLGPNFKDAPKPMQQWLRGLGMSNSYEEYEGWSECLTKSFGARRYAEMKLPDHLY